MERQALMRWHGPVLYADEAWQREVARLARAAGHGSALGAHMQTVPQRAAAAWARDPGRCTGGAAGPGWITPTCPAA
jgi:hypothetical protein